MEISETKIKKHIHKAFREQRRLIAPLMGFPGLQITGRTIKLAQQNITEHVKAILSLADRFRPDMIFSFMDLSIEANALGCYTVFPKNDPPTVTKNDFSFDQIPYFEKIDICEDTRLYGYVETIRRLRMQLPPEIMLGAYVSAPYTLAGMAMGAEDAAMATILNSGDLEKLCTVLSVKIRKYAMMLADAGAESICFLDPAAVMLGPESFDRFAVDPINKLVRDMNGVNTAWLYHVCGNSTPLSEKIASLEVDGVSLDSQEAGVNLATLAETLPDEMIIFGNLNPTGTILHGNPSEVASETETLLKMMDTFPNYILSTGCDLPEKTPLENLDTFMKTGRKYRIGSKG